MPFVKKKDRKDLYKWMNENGRPTAVQLEYVTDSLWAEYLASKEDKSDKPEPEVE